MGEIMGYYKYAEPLKAGELKNKDIETDYFDGWETGRGFWLMQSH